MSTFTRRLLLAVLLGVAVYGAVVLMRGYDAVASEFGQFEWWTAAAACGLAFGNYLLRFAKWEYYLRVLGVRHVPKLDSLLIFLSGFVLTVTPGKVGEVFKSLVLKETYDVEVERTAPVVVAERATDVIGIIALIAIGSAAFPGGVAWATAGALAVLALLVFVASERATGGMLGLFGRFPGILGKFARRVRPRVEAGLSQLRTLTEVRHLVIPTLLSFVGWALEGVALWVILKGFHTDAPVTQSGFFYAVATLAGALIPVPGGLGVTEKVMEEGMVQLGGIPAAVGTSAMLLVRLATLWFAVALGFLALGILRARFPTLMRGQVAETDVTNDASPPA